MSKAPVDWTVSERKNAAASPRRPVCSWCRGDEDLTPPPKTKSSSGEYRWPAIINNKEYLSEARRDYKYLLYLYILVQYRTLRVRYITLVYIVQLDKLDLHTEYSIRIFIFNILNIFNILESYSTRTVYRYTVNYLKYKI